MTGIADQLNPAASELYMYADNGFLESAVGPWGTPVTASTSLYSLVSGSNRLAGVTTDGTPTREFDSDLAGNVTEDTDLSTSTVKELAYNHPGQLTSFELGGVAQGIYTYDYLSLLAARELPGASTTLHYVHDRDGNVIAEYDSTGTLLREYVWLDDRPIAAIEPGTPDVVYSVHTDHLERPVMMTDDSANVVWQAKYLPYGEVYSITGSAALDYRFPGQWFQLESGLHYNWHRHYDPTTGRYVQPDPLGMPDGPGRWAYAQNTPLIAVDPTGLLTASDLIIFPPLFWPFLSSEPAPEEPQLCEPPPYEPLLTTPPKKWPPENPVWPDDYPPPRSLEVEGGDAAAATTATRATGRPLVGSVDWTHIW